jgi:hypothetical protein
MKNNLLVLIILLIFLFTTAITIAEILPDEKGIQLEQGENEILMSLEFSPIYVSDLIKAYPEIMMITYFDEISEEEIGYVNVFGGIGENFIMYADKTYFITVEEKLEVSFK